MQSSIVRQCLLHLSDAEIEALLLSSEKLRETIRVTGHRPRGATIDVRGFRQWLKIPGQSDRLLNGLPQLYASEMETRSVEGAAIAHSVGEQSVLFLAARQGNISVDEFVDHLRRLREAPSGEVADPPATAAELSEQIEVLRATASEFAAHLTAMAGRVRDGMPLELSLAELQSWNAAVEAVAATLREVEGSEGIAGFEAMDHAVRTAAAREAELAAATERRAQQWERLENLRGAARGFEPLIGDEFYRNAHERATTEIQALEAELGIEPPAPAEAPVADVETAAVAELDDLAPPPAEFDTPEVAEVRADLAPEPQPVEGDDQDGPADEIASSRTDSVAPADVLDAELARHVGTGNFAAAWLIAQAGGLPPLDVAAFELAAMAFNSGPGSIDSSEALVALTSLPDGEFSSAGFAAVALAAALRAALLAGWVPRSELESVVRQANPAPSWKDLVDESIHACDRHYQHVVGVRGLVDSADDDARERARALRTLLENRQIGYPRADKVLKVLLWSSEALGAALEAVVMASGGEARRAALAGALARIGNADDLIEEVDARVSSPQQLRAKIVAWARSALVRSIEDVYLCVNEALEAELRAARDSRPGAAQESGRKLVLAARAVRTGADGGSVGELALGRLVEWILAPASPEGVLTTADLLVQAALPVTSAERGPAGLPVLAGCDAEQVVAALREPAPDAELFQAYAGRGDLFSAGVLAVRSPELADQFAACRIDWGHRLTREVTALRADLGRTYVDDTSQETFSDFEARLVTPENYSGDRFDLELESLQQMRNELADHRSGIARRLTADAAEVVQGAEERKRIAALIANEDFIGANELLALARIDQPLPPIGDRDDAAGAHVFDAFTAALERIEHDRAAGIKDVVAQLTEHGIRKPIAKSDLDRLEGWNRLRTLNVRSGKLATQTINSILRALGIDVRGDLNDCTARGVRHYRLYKLAATPIDGSLVPGLGSQATRYSVAVTADATQLKQTLTSAFPAGNGPNLVLFDGVLTREQRDQCLATCRTKQISAIVIDHAVAVFVASRYPQSFRAVQQLTLPFTCFGHYTVVAGNVPDEVFVGRAEELKMLEARDGSLFVYGGRQLGKSALLRKLQRDFSAVPDQHAVFIDLNSHGIGTWAESAKLWPVLFEELRAAGGIVPKGLSGVRQADRVVREIRDWLRGKETRRLLVLLDEADAFLDKESTSQFANIGPLKRLFDDSEGRFKPVFAGLHKVQRLQNVSNTPLAHGGRDILIGPLEAAPARDLVVRPLEALGYRFQNAESVWRLLAFTNLQAGLIQIVCTDLIKHLQSRAPRRGEPLIVIQDSDVDVVTKSKATRDRIAEKLRLTIDLDIRYRVIALTVAAISMDDRFRSHYSASEIRIWCELYWEAGFADLTSAQFAVYLDELVGLGVLIRTAEQCYMVRSPNIVTMLGSKIQLITELEESRQFELPHEYNPRSTRRTVQQSATGTIRSPLSEHDLGLLLPVSHKYDSSNFVVVGSAALGIGDVHTVLRAVAGERNVDLTVQQGVPPDVPALIEAFRFAGTGTSAPRALVIDASGADQASACRLAAGLRGLAKRRRGHLIAVFGADGVTAAQSLSGSGPRFTSIRLERWSGDAIRAWHDNPLNTPTERKKLLGVSSGWPQLVERAVVEVSSTDLSHAQVCDILADFPESRDRAEEFLRDVGVRDDQRTVLSHWAQLGDDARARIEVVAAVLERPVQEVQRVAQRLEVIEVLAERDGEYAIDPVVYRALRRADA
ncbi:ATP-binding protein [Nocardia sp. NPDC057353]|uniref:ATP-binding protein n=1 Tax=Nocardia sp. NPDC057353 TaxID=3346104 RepID=UPI003628E86C